MVEKVIFSLLGLGVHRSTGFSDIICSPLIFPFFQSRSTCQRDGLVMAPFAAKKRGTKRIIRQPSNTGGEKVEEV